MINELFRTEQDAVQDGNSFGRYVQSEHHYLSLLLNTQLCACDE